MLLLVQVMHEASDGATTTGSWVILTQSMMEW